MTKHTRSFDRKPNGKLTATALALAGVAALSSGAEAQSGSTPDGFQPISDVDGVSSVHVQADGSVELIMDNGQVVNIASADVIVQDGIVYLSTSSLEAASLIGAGDAGGGAGAIIGVLAGGGLAAAAGGGGGGGGPSTPPPPTNANPPVFTSATSASVDENTSGAVYTATATDADGNSISFSISGGADAANFSINSSTGALTFVGNPDFENPADSDTNNTYEVTIRVSDGVHTTEQTVTITVDDVNEAPVFTSAATASVAENQTAAYTAVATDEDASSTVSYSLSGADAALFAIDSATGVVTFLSAPDFEAPGDADSDNAYEITVTASDGTLTTDQAVTVTVTDENEFSPVFTSAASASVPENQTAAYTAVATDADGSDSITYSISGTDSALFKINAATGVVTFITPPNYEDPGSQNFDLIVTASDGSNSTDQAVTITVTNVNEAPVFLSDTSASVAENQTSAYTAVADDGDLTIPTYSIVGGADLALFTIDAVTGVVTFLSAPNFESPGDADGNNNYEIIVRASDGVNDTDQSVTINVTNLNDNSPVFSSAATASVVEGSSEAYDADASDGDASDSLTYTLSGTDSALFNIDASTGVVTFKTTPDFEIPADGNGDNDYEFTVTASDGTNTTDQTVVVTVTDGNDNVPVFTSAVSSSVAENSTTAYTATATDPDPGDTPTFSIAGGADAALFSIDSATGVVSFVSAPDFETPGDANGDNDYQITIRATDGANTTDQSITISVTDENDNSPVFSSAATASVAENQTSAYDADATDGDAGTTLTYSISGTDSALFNIDATTGVVTFISAPDFQTPSDSDGNNDYEFTVTASDGANTTDQAVTVSVTEVDENADVPGDSSTNVNLLVGNTYDGELEVLGDTDWIRVELVAGQRYAISMDGSGANPLIDPLVRLYDSNGNLVAENDDGGTGRNSLLSYTVQESGTYYIEADAWTDNVEDYTGTYTIGLEETAPLTAFSNDQIAEYLETGFWGGTPRRWDVSEGDTITVNITGLTVDGQTLARAALQNWSDITGIIFSEVTTGGQITFDDEDEGAYASSTVSGGFIISSTINIATDWVSSDGDRLDGYRFQTYIHEIGHALGLGHAGPYNGSATYGVDEIYLNDSWQASVMSYFSQRENTYVDASFAYVIGPQVADILAIQNMYGLSTNTRSGDTVYGYNANTANPIFDITSIERQVSYTIFDTGGNDTMDFSGSGAVQTLDLRQESFSSTFGATGNIGIARGTVIENAIGGSNNDTLIGNDADNVLTGNAGNDRFISSGGADVFNGGAGTDTAVFSGQASDYTITTNGSGNDVYTDNRVGSPDGSTELIDIENIEFGATSAPFLAAVKDDTPLMDGLTAEDLRDFANAFFSSRGFYEILAEGEFGPILQSLSYSFQTGNLVMDKLDDKSKDASVADVMKVLDDGIVAENIVGLSSEPFDEQSLKTGDNLIMDELDLVDLLLSEGVLALPTLSGVIQDENGMLSLVDDDVDMLSNVLGQSPVLSEKGMIDLGNMIVGFGSDLLGHSVSIPDTDGAGFAVLNEDGFGGEVLVSEPLLAKSGVNDSAPVMEPISDIESPDIQALPVPDMPEGWFA